MSIDKETQKIIDEARESLLRMQEFDTSTLPRVKELGSKINFSEAVEPTDRLVDLYRQLPCEVLESISRDFIQRIKSQADSDYNRLEQILKFEAGTPQSQRNSLINSLESAYDPTFQVLHPVISYSVRKSTDFAKLERDARAQVQSINDRADELQKQLEQRATQAEQVLKTIRKVAEEQGVSQQAIYFKNEAEEHKKGSKRWLITTICLTVVLGIYAVSVLLLYKSPFLVPTNTYEAVQVGISKVLIFATISFFLALAVKNFLAHRHNMVVNKHRQNALVTYQVLVKAAGDEANRDIVLTKAAECIFSPQVTGFNKGEPSEGTGLSVVSLAPKALREITEAGG